MSNETAMSVYLSNDNTKKYLNSILGERSGQFITSLTSLAGSSEMLKNCDRNSLLACALKAVSMELPFDPNLGFTLVRSLRKNRHISNRLKRIYPTRFTNRAIQIYRFKRCKRRRIFR